MLGTRARCSSSYSVNLPNVHTNAAGGTQEKTSHTPSTSQISLVVNVTSVAFFAFGAYRAVFRYIIPALELLVKNNT